MTALRWMTSYDHVQIKGTGRVGDVCWMHAFAWNVGEPGETPHYIVIERANGAICVIRNPTDAERSIVATDPLALWNCGNYPIA